MFRRLHAITFASALCAAFACAGCGLAGEGDSSATASLDPRKLVLETDLGGSEARAGQLFSVTCRTFAPPPAGSPADTWGAEVPLPGVPTVVVLDGPGEPLLVDGLQLKFAKVGTYLVACRIPAYGLQDPTPAELGVVPGLPAAIDTQLLAPASAPPGTPASPVAAGTAVAVACTAQDAYGNAFASGFSLTLTPPLPNPPIALAFTPTKTGTIAVACTVDAIADTTPALLQVVPAVPRHLYTLVDPAEIQAGGAAKLACVANDAYGNAIPEFPFAIDLPPAVQLKGLYLTSTLTGLHDVRCVPESLAWNLFVVHAATLSVLPGPPKFLDVATVPAKQVYKREEKVQFLPSVRDAWDNVVGDAKVTMAVTSPAAGFKVKSADTIQFNLDNTYLVHFQVVDHGEVARDVEILIDGAPPLLTIDQPPWGSTLTGKPSVYLEGTVGDAGSGVVEFVVDGKQPPIGAPDAAGLSKWGLQHGAKHGLNPILAEVTDLGGQKSKAIRGFYYSGQYYPTDAQAPQAAMVTDGLQVFAGKDFLDDGVHDPAHPNDLATLIEVMLGGLDPNQLIPGAVSQGDVQVTLSNISFGKPTVNLVPVDGGLQLKVAIPNIHTDLAVKAKQKLGPISITLKVSGAVDIANVTVQTLVLLSVVDGKAQVAVGSSQATIDGMNLHVDGIAGLFDFLWNLLLQTYTSQLEAQLVQTLNGQVPKLIQGLLENLALDQTFTLPPLVPGAPEAQVSLVTALKQLQCSPAGVLVRMDASFVAPKGTAHTVLGSIGRAGCIGTVQDAFVIDQSQRLQLALHDDVLNQALHAIWYGGALKIDGVTATQLGLDADPSKTGGFSLEGATFDVDFFLPPILESCNQTDGKFRLQVGDLYGKAKLLDGDLQLGLFLGLDMGAQIALGKSPEGAPQLSVQLDPELNLQYELFDISKAYAGSKSVFENLFAKLLGDALKNGIPGLDALKLNLPSLDLGGLVPGLPAGTKIQLQLKNLKRAGGYTAIDAGLE